MKLSLTICFINAKYFAYLQRAALSMALLTLKSFTDREMISLASLLARLPCNLLLQTRRHAISDVDILRRID